MKRWAAIAGIALAALAGAFWAGRATAPRPAVHAVESVATTSNEAAKEEVHRQSGPLDATITVGGPCPAGSPKTRQRPPQTVTEAIAELPPGSTVVLHEGPSSEDVHRTEQHAEASQTHLDLTITPAGPPGWAVSVGVDDPLGARQVRIALRRRLFGPFAVEVAAVPARGLSGVGAALAVEF